MKNIAFILGLSCTSQVYPCTWWGDPYYTADEKHFALKDYVNQKVAEQRYLSSKQYFDERFGSNNWEMKPDAYKIVAPELVDEVQNVRITIRSNAKEVIYSNVYVIAELVANNKYAYIDLAHISKQHRINEFSTSYRIPYSINIFVIGTRVDSKTIISGPRHIKQNPGCGYIKVRTQTEANTLNKKICDKVPSKNKSSEPACIELKKHVSLENSS